MQNSAEKHGIIVCGEGIRPRNNMNVEAYKNLCKNMDVRKREEFKKYLIKRSNA